MRTVWIRHPVTRAESQIPASALPHWVGAGWQQFDPTAPAVSSADQPATKQRRRRADTAEES